MLSIDDVRKLADLALLDVSDEEAAKLSGEMDAIVTYISELSSLQSDIGEQAVPEHRNVFRDDSEPYEAGTFSQKLLDAAPHTEKGYVKVKKII